MVTVMLNDLHAFLWDMFTLPLTGQRQTTTSRD